MRSCTPGSHPTATLFPNTPLCRCLTVPCSVFLHTDSQYVRQGITEWMPNGLRRNWKTAGGAAVKNRDLWERLHAATGRHKIDWRWVKGHSGDPDNERVDVLARDEAIKLKAVAGTML